MKRAIPGGGGVFLVPSAVIFEIGSHVTKAGLEVIPEDDLKLLILLPATFPGLGL